MRKLVLFVFMTGICLSQSGQLRVGFDIDDTVLYSEPAFQEALKNGNGTIDYHWINEHDKDYSLLIKPTADLINFFLANGHRVFFITARKGGNGHHLATFLSAKLDMEIRVDKELFFSPKEKVNGFDYTTKHEQMKKLGLDLFYGDADQDMIAALKADVYPVRVIRHSESVKSYGKNYFGDTNRGNSPKYPFNKSDLDRFYGKGVGVFGESIYPILWDSKIP